MTDLGIKKCEWEDSSGTGQKEKLSHDTNLMAVNLTSRYH
jgi:hypothetical protein